MSESQGITPEQAIVKELEGSRQYLAQLGHSYAGKWLDANARYFIAKKALTALESAGYEVVPRWNQYVGDDCEGV